MKRYTFCVVAVLVVALAAAGGALAEGHHRATAHHASAGKRAVRPAGRAPAHTLVPSFAPHPRAWLKALSEFPRNPTPPHRAKPPLRHVPSRLRATTLSIYEQTAKRSTLAAQGCSAAHRHENGIVVLDFGKPAFVHGGYGTIVFSGRFATNHKITAATLAYARGYVSCLPQGSSASIEIARGTSNYHPAVPSAYDAGVRWGHETNKLGWELARHGLAAHVEAAAADDAEPAWDRSFRKTRQFFHGFRAAVHGHTLYDYGSLDGGVGAVWTARQAWYVAGGLRHTKALPEIYNSAMAQEWAELARIATGRYHRAVHFAGVMTQGTSTCDCGLRPPEAHRVLAQALSSQGIDHVDLPAGGTNIVG